MFPGFLLQLLLVLVVVGILLWGLSRLPIDPQISNIIRVVVIVVVAIWIVYILFGVIGSGFPPLYPRR